MLNSLSNKAMITKSRAMYGKRLTNENYQDLVRMKSVREIASYLKETPGYADVLSNIYPESVHRGQLELLLHKSLFNKYIRLTHYDVSGKSNFLSFVVSRLEIEQILRCIMGINANNTENFIVDLPGYLISHASFPMIKLAKIKTFEELLEVIDKTPYEKVIRQFTPKNGELIDYTGCEVSLRTLYYTRMFSLIQRDFKGKHRDELEEILKIEVELINVSTIFRLKSFFKMDGQEIRKYLFPFTYKLKKERLENLLQAESGEDIFRMINSSSYGNKIDNDEFSYIEDDIRRLNAYYNKQLLRFSSNAPAVVYCFMSLAQIELINITNIIEGVRYNLSAEEIRKLLVLF